MDINIKCFDTQHEHGERNRRCVKSKPFMARIDEEIQNPDVTPETKKNIFLNLFTNKAWVPKWLLIDLLSKSESDGPEPDQDGPEPDQEDQP